VQNGTRELGHNVKVGYFSQYRVDMLDPKMTVLETARDMANPVSEQVARTVLGSFLFRGDDVFKKVNVLSGGEKSRLALVKLLLDPPNLILMDEPTTHLDIPSIDALAAALDQYEGTLIFISHDVYFIRALANHVVRVSGGQLTHFGGGYQYYLDKTSATSERAALTSDGREAMGGLTSTSAREQGRNGTRPSADRKEQKRLEAGQRQARSRERKAQQQIVHRLEKEIAELEARQVELTAELEKPETYGKSGAALQINRELTHDMEDLKRLTGEWEQAASKLAELDA
jgi:ATP-binding cassette subfamily F protein 3